MSPSKETKLHTLTEMLQRERKEMMAAAAKIKINLRSNISKNYFEFIGSVFSDQICKIQRLNWKIHTAWRSRLGQNIAKYY
jgi:hypothetical protein